MTDMRLIRIIRNLLNKSDFEYIEIDDWKSLISNARTHSVLPCVSYYFATAPEEYKPNADIMGRMQRLLLQESALSTHQLYAVDEMQKAFEENGIYNLVVKGVRTKQRYPEEVFRSMGDVDVLYRVEQHNQVRKIMEDLNYDGFEEGRKNDTYSRKPHIHIEAHRQLVSSESQFLKYLESVWERAVLEDDCKYTYKMTLEDEYIYNIIHLVEHFKNGGIGVRFIMDIWVYEQLQMNREYLKNELEKLCLYDFYLNIASLAKYWFGDGEGNELIYKLGEYIFSGGVFGSFENDSDIAVSESGKLMFFIKICFPSYSEMASMFPWLKKCPILLPFAWILRIFRSLFFRRKNVKANMNLLKNGDVEAGKEKRKFQKECGL